MKTTEAQALADLLDKIETLAENYVDCAKQARADSTDEPSRLERVANVAAASVYDGVVRELRELLK